MHEAVSPLFIATQRFDPTDGERWSSYFEWAKIPNLREVVSLDAILCPRLVDEFLDADWQHMVLENFRLDYFNNLTYLRQRVRHIGRRNILGLYRNSPTHVAAPPASDSFQFIGHDLIEEKTQISALTNCGGFPDVFDNTELNQYGLLEDFDRATEVRRSLAEKHPEEPHAQCELYAVWRLNEERASSVRISA